MKLKNTGSTINRICFIPIIIPLMILTVLQGCQNKETKSGVTKEQSEYNNRFFTLDLERDSVSMAAFQKVFFNNFPHDDPTRGDVVYDQSKWLHDDLFEIKQSDGLYAYLRFRDDSLGFDSYRFTSKAYFNLDEQTEKLLFVFKGRFPSAPGMWPAWWLNGSAESNWTYRNNSASLNDKALERHSGKGQFHNTSSSVNNTDWPAYGEIDIIENINGQKDVHNVIHTCPQMCDSEWNGDGQIINCANAQPGDFNRGCSGPTYEVDSLAGTFACIWGKNEIDYYYWPTEASVRKPGGPLTEEPDPSSWTAALKNRVRLIENEVKCDRKKHQDWQCNICDGSDRCEFKNMKMIFNVTLCGAWAGEHFDESPNALNNCKDYILGEGKQDIDGQFMKIEYVAARKLEN